MDLGAFHLEAVAAFLQEVVANPHQAEAEAVAAQPSEVAVAAHPN